MSSLNDKPTPFPLPGQSFDANQSKDTADSIAEARQTLQALIDVLSEFSPTILVINGRRYVFLADEVGAGGDIARLGFQAFEDKEKRVFFYPSLVTGFSSTALIPKVGGVTLDTVPRPTLQLQDGEWAGMYFEVEPTTETTVMDEETVYLIREGGGTLVGDIEIRRYTSRAAMDVDPRPAMVNPESGSTINGKFIIPLVQRTNEGTLIQYYNGPIGIRMCSSGHFVAHGATAAIYGTIP